MFVRACMCVNVCCTCPCILTVGLSTVAVHPQPLFVDRTPPQAGYVRDGSTPLMDADYQSSTSEVCVNYNGFMDPDSGISSFLWSVVSGGAEVFRRELTMVEMTLQTACEAVSLPHNTRYYSTLTAFNGGSNGMNATGSSDGGTCAAIKYNHSVNVQCVWDIRLHIVVYAYSER